VKVGGGVLVVKVDVAVGNNLSVGLVNNVGSIGEISVDDRTWGDGLVIVICEIGGSESSGTPARD
jgi:hypothetical protein